MEINLQNFKGINLDENNWKESYASYVAGLDIWGLAKNPSKISYPGVLQGIFDVSAGTQAASPSAVTELPGDFVRYISQDFAIGWANPGRIYRRDSNSWKWVSAITVSSMASPSGALKVYGANLYYAQASVLGQYDNTNGNANFQTLGNSSVSPRGMAILNGNLYGLDNNLIWMYDGTTFTSAKLTLPSQYTGKSIEVYGDFLFISADQGEYSTIFVWDGLAATYQNAVNMYEESTAPSLKATGGILWIVSNRGGTITGTPIYIYTGGEVQKILTLPLKRTTTFGLGEYAGGLAIASGEGATAAYEDGLAGIWVVNRYNSGYPFSATLLFPFRDEYIKKTLGGITFFGQNGYMGVEDTNTSTFEIFELQGSNANATNIWQSLPIDAGSTSEKIWHYIKINFENLVTGQTLVVKYRLDDTTSFTTLKTFSTTGSAAQNKQFIPLGRSSRTITIRVELTASASETVRVHSITLGYTPTRK